MLKCLTSFQKSLLVGVPLEYLLVYTSRFHIAQVALELTKLPGAIKQIDFAVVIKKQRSIMIMRRTGN